MPQLLDPVSRRPILQDDTDQQNQQVVQPTTIQQQTTQPAQQPPNPDAPTQPPVDASGYSTNALTAAQRLVANFDQYIASGGDRTQITQDDLGTVDQAVKRLPDYQDKAASPSVMYSLFKQGKERNIMTELATKGPLVTGIEQVPGIALGIPQFAKTLLGDAGQFLYHNIYAIPIAQDIGAMLHGDLSFSHLQNNQAQQESALVQAVRSNYDNYTKNLPAGAAELKPLYDLASARAHETDPDKAAQLDFAQSEILRSQAQRDKQSAQNMVDARNAVANQYTAIGMGDFADRLMKAQPSEGDLMAMGQLTDPLTYLSFGAEPLAKAAIAQFFKAGVRTTALAEAGAALTAIEDKLAGIDSARTSLNSILTGRAGMTDTTRAGYQSNLARLDAVQSKLLKDYAAAQTEHAGAIADVNKQMDTMAKANPFRQVTGQLVQAVGATGELPSKIAKFVESIPEGIVNRFMPDADEATKATATAAVKRWSEGAVELTQRVIGGAVGGALGLHVGGPLGLIGGFVGGVGGGVAPEVLRTIGKVLPNMEQLGKFARDLQTVGEQYALGQQTLPFWKAQSEKLTGVSSWLASKMDNQLVYAIPSAATGGAIGGAMGGTQGLLMGGGNEQKFQAGVAQGAFFGAAGGGLGQLRHFNSLAELRQAAIGDRSRFLGALTTPNREMFSKLHPEYQLAISTYGMAHPDLDIHFTNDPGGSNGSYTANNPRPTALINVAGDNPLQAIASHEVAHHIAAHGLGQTVADHILGNPVTGQKGIATALDEHGNPMTETDPKTGKARYVQNAEFEAYKAQYNARKLRDNPGAMPEDDYGIAQEMFADLHSEYITNRETLQKLVRGHIPSDLVSENATANWLTKMGMGADATTGNPIPTSALEGADALKGVIDNFYRQRQYKKFPVDTGGDRGDTRVPVGDIIKGTPEFDRIQKNLDASGDLHRNPDGTIAVDLAGRPRVKTPREADADHAQLGRAINDLYKAQPGLEGTESDNYLKLVTDRNGRQVRRGQRVPEAVYQELERTNQFNANQLLNWRKMDGVMQRNDGSMMLNVYNTATKGKGRYATLSARERAFVPIYSEVSPVTDQVNIAAYDPEQLQANLAKRLRTQKGKDLYNGQIGPALDDVRTYMQNLANDRPGETGIGMQKKGFINELFGLNADANPYAADITKRSQDVFKTFRLDRINRVSEVAGAQEPYHAKTYEQVRSFMQPREGEQFQPRFNPTDRQVREATNVKKDQRTDEHNDILARRTIYDWNRQPNTVQMDVRRNDNGAVVTDKDGNIQYKTQGFNLRDAPVIQRLTNRYGAQGGFDRGVNLLTDRLVNQYNQWKDLPDLQAAVGWYSGMRDRLQAQFGANIDKFANTLAATSAQESVKVNFRYTLEALRKMSQGDYNALMSDFRDYATKVTDQIMADPSITDKPGAIRKEINKFGDPKSGIGDVPLKENGTKYGINSKKVLHALTDYWVDQAGGPKTSNFGENLSWRSTDPTIDVWAGRTARRLLYEPDVKRWRLAPSQEGGIGGRNVSGIDDYGMAEAGFKQAAQKLGITPDDFQALMWFGEKRHYVKNNWTSGAGAELGDFRDIMDTMGFQRYQAGLTTDRPGNPGDLEGARREMEQTIQGLGDGVVAQRATKSQGLYDRKVEPTLDVEFTTKQGHDVSSVEDKIKELAARHDQDSAFLSRIHDDPNHPNARPIVELGFDEPAKEGEIQSWAKAFEDYGLGGFTIARDSRGKALGIRSQAIPEFAGEGVDPKKYMHDWLVGLNHMRSDPSLPWENITYNKNRYADTKLFFKGKDYHPAR
jgi:hypothetical protein